MIITSYYALKRHYLHLIGLPDFGVGDTKTWQESPDVFFFPFPAHLIIRACAHGEKYGWLARLGYFMSFYGAIARSGDGPESLSKERCSHSCLDPGERNA